MQKTIFFARHLFAQLLKMSLVCMMDAFKASGGPHPTPPPRFPDSATVISPPLKIFFAVYKTNCRMRGSLHQARSCTILMSQYIQTSRRRPPKMRRFSCRLRDVEVSVNTTNRDQTMP